MQIVTPAFCDMHVHLRQGTTLDVVNEHAKYCQYILAMPNTNPPIFTGGQVREYDGLVKSALKPVDGFRPLYTIYVNEQTTMDDIYEAKDAGVIAGKVYPKAATTNSDQGVVDYTKLFPVFEAMEEVDMVLCLHGETPKPSPSATVLDWEREFVKGELTTITNDFRKLRIVLEHITTKEAVSRVRMIDNVYATITAHHLLITIDDILARGIQSLNYCKPVAKLVEDLEAVQSAALCCNIDKKFMFGSDSAPHDENAKFCACGAAGCFTAPHAFSLVTEFFADMAFGQGDNDFAGLRRLAYENFTCNNAKDFYGLSDTGRTITLEKKDWEYPQQVHIGGKNMPLFRGMETGRWSLKES